jgi:hypothetical protein
MAGGKSSYLANKVLDHILGNTAYTTPTTLYVALFTAMPTSTGGGTEVSGGSYARLSVTNNSTNWPAASSQTKRNGIALTFAAPTANWGTLVGAAIFDASTGGNMLYFGPFSVNRVVNNGDPAFSIPANAGQFTES